MLGVISDLKSLPTFTKQNFHRTTSNFWFRFLFKMLSILRKARLKDKEMRILLLWVHPHQVQMSPHLPLLRGLDAAGKTTICKKLLDEPIDGVSPTLGFIIKTIDYDGSDRHSYACLACWYRVSRYKLNICTTSDWLDWAAVLTTAHNRGRRRPKDSPHVLEELLWEDWHPHLGGWLDGCSTSWGLPRRADEAPVGRG